MLGFLEASVSVTNVFKRCLQVRFALALLVLAVTQFGFLSAVLTPAYAGDREVYQDPTYSHSAVVESNNLTFTVYWEEPVLGKATRFHVVYFGGSSAAQVRMAAPYYFEGTEASGESVANPSSEEFASYYTLQDGEHDFTFTMMASGSYRFTFYLTDEAKGIRDLCSQIVISLNDSSYPSVSSIAQTAVSQAKAATDGSNYKMALWLHDWVLNRVACDSASKWTSAEAALTRGLGSDEAYASAYGKLLDAAGITNAKICDTYDSHTWNAAKIDGNWYQIDCLCDDNSNSAQYGFDTRHLYFGLTDELVALVHPGFAKIYTKAGYTTRSTHLEANYYVQHGEAACWASKFVNTIQKKMDALSSSFTLDTAWGHDASTNCILNSVIAWNLSHREWATNSGLQATLAASAAEKAISCTISYASLGWSFCDVDSNTSHNEDITWLAAVGVSAGWSKDDGTREFRPYSKVARADMAAFLYRLAGSPAYTVPSKSPFKDCDASTPHYKEICWLAEKGISEGWTVTGGKEFRPYATVARCDMAAFLYRMAGSPAYSVPATSPFKDCAANKTPHYEEVCWLASTGVSEGWTVAGGKEFRSYEKVARSDMAAFLHRMKDKGLV